MEENGSKSIIVLLKTMIINKIKYYIIPNIKKQTKNTQKKQRSSSALPSFIACILEPRFPRNLRQGGERNNAKNVRVQTSCGLTRAASLLSCRLRRKRLLATGSFFQSLEINFDAVEVEDPPISRRDEKVVGGGEFEKQRNEKKKKENSSVFPF